MSEGDGPPPGFTKVGRIAFRAEDGHWNAYYALNETMDGAIFLGCIPMTFVKMPKVKELFIDCVRAGVAEILREKAGGELHWREPEPAPEHERGKRHD
jgi:hypothetical protein